MVHPSARLARFRLRFLLFAVLAAGMSIITVVAPMGHAYASPSCSQINAQLDQMWNQLEPVIEQYNHVHATLQQNQAKQTALAKKIAPLQLQVDIAMTRVSSISDYLYKSGPLSVFNAMLDSGSPTTLADQLSTIDVLAKDQQDMIKGVSAAVGQYNTQKQPLDVLVSQQQQQDAALATQKNSIISQQNAMQKLRMNACGVDINGVATRLGPCPANYYGDAGSRAAQFACNQIGKPYVWAAAGPNAYDCSGLTMAAWASVGVSLPHYTVWQRQDTAYVSRANLRPGDLVFFYSDLHHVGIYVGNGWIVHAPQTGDVVRMANMNLMPINSFGRPS